MMLLVVRNNTNTTPIITSKIRRFPVRAPLRRQHHAHLAAVVRGRTLPVKEKNPSSYYAHFRSSCWNQFILQQQRRQKQLYHHHQQHYYRSYSDCISVQQRVQYQKLQHQQWNRITKPTNAGLQCHPWSAILQRHCCRRWISSTSVLSNRGHPHIGLVEESIIPPPSKEQLKRLFMTTMIPMLGFGFMDQTVMIQAGNAIDCSIGVYFGLSTLVAAALGQVVSGGFAALFGGYMDAFFSKMGLPRSGLSAPQRTLPQVQRTKLAANFIGVVVGCLLGLVNFVFIDTEQATMMKLEALANDVEFAYEIMASNKMRPDATVVTVRGPDITGILASITTALSESDYDLREVRALNVSASSITDSGHLLGDQIDDMLVIVKHGQQVPSDELEDLAQLLLQATKTPTTLLKAQAREKEMETLKERINQLEKILRQKQIQIEDRDDQNDDKGTDEKSA